MECISTVEKIKTTFVVNDNPDFPTYILLSSIAYESSFWLPADIVHYITINAHNITQLLVNLKLDCREPTELLTTTYRLNCLYCPNMSLALLKIYFNDHKTSPLDIKSINWHTVFDYIHEPDSNLEPEIKILCQLVDKKAFVDHFKEQCFPFFVRKTNLLHRLVRYNRNPQIIRLYCGVFMAYAQNCPKKSGEVLHLLNAKNDYGDTVIDVAKTLGLGKTAAIFKNTKKQLKQNIQEKENCVIQ